ncbi:sterol desaturase family protein [Dongia sp.]|uniref:sterol desaturase family protein n=1 Tax=Dongia sp. TaxID=1977262 RepID=UPI003751F1E5
MTADQQGWLGYALIGKSVLVLAWLIAVIVIENRWASAIVPLRIAGYGRAWFQRWGRNLGFFALNAGLAPLLVLPVTFFAAANPLWPRPIFLSFPYSLPLDLLLLDLWIYAWHRANHELPILWRFHEVHHRDAFLDATTALRFHFGEVVIAAVARAIVIFLLAIPLGSVLVFETLVLLAAIFHHSNWRLPAAIEQRLARVIITPSLHWVHHHKQKSDTDSIYGTLLSLWDRLFDTGPNIDRRRDMPIGVEGEKEVNLLRLLALPFYRS